MILYLIRHLASGKVYVGKTKLTLSARWKQHVQSARYGSDHHIHAAIRKYSEAAFETLELCQVPTNQEACQVEQFLILLFQSRSAENGYNMTRGGDGVLDPVAEARVKMATQKGRIPWNKGKSGTQVAWNKGRNFSPEARARMSQSAKGRVPWNKGIGLPKTSKTSMKRQMSDATKAAIAASLRQSWKIDGEAHRSAIVVANTGKPCSRDTRNKISAALSGRKKSEQTRSAISKTLTGRVLSEARRQAMSDGLSRHYATDGDAHRAAVRAAHLGKKLTPEHREKIRLSWKLRKEAA